MCKVLVFLSFPQPPQYPQRLFGFLRNDFLSKWMNYDTQKELRNFRMPHFSLKRLLGQISYLNLANLNREVQYSERKKVARQFSPPVQFLPVPVREKIPSERQSIE